MTIHLLSTINRDYVVPFRVMAHSLHTHRRATAPATWHIFASGLSAHERAAIEAQLERAAIETRWYRETGAALSGLPVRGRAIAGMYQRIFAPDVLGPDVRRLLYLDGDLLFLDDVETLWRSDIGGSVLGAVQDAIIPRVSSPLGLSEYRALGFQQADPYFNAGVYVADLDAWRAARVGEQAMAYVHRYRRSINFADQDVLNAVLRGRWTRLDDRWNIVGGAAGRAHFRPRGIDAARLAAAVRTPGIVHFSGHLKPWMYRGLGSKWADAYADALREACPEYRFDRTVKTVGTVFYDRYLRSSLYPLERLAWRTSRHLR